MDHRTHRFSQVDVFTEVAFSGNPLAVIHDADGLSDAQMTAIARWTNLSETTFLLRPTAQADYRVRIFTPGAELPFAGHPTLGSATAWLDAGGAARDSVEIVQECGIGLVRLRRDGARLAFAAPPLRRAAIESDALVAACTALGLKPSAIRASSWLDNGPRWLAILVDSAASVLAIEPDHSAIARLPKIGVIGPCAKGEETAFEVRAFAASVGVFEDPVTGSLNAALGEWLMAEGVMPEQVTVSQGARIGRVGRVHLKRDASTLWVGGNVMPRIVGTIAV